jgi:hypothetical protein
MGIAVYANGMSIACKAASGKTIAAMPDVCLSPPTPPAGPIPIPYPNTAMASDTDGGSKTVQIGGQEVMLKDQSTFKKSSGDEAATKSLGMGVVTHQIQGKANFVAWSMDVKFEGQNVPRHLDLMGHNEASSPPNTPPWPYLDSMTVSAGVIQLECDPDWDDCQKEQAREKVRRMDQLAKQKNGLRRRSTVGNTRDLGNTWAAKFRSDFNRIAENKPRSKLVFTAPGVSGPTGTSSDFMHPCLSEQWRRSGEGGSNSSPVNACSPDHVQDLQWGGHVQGPLVWLDRDVNEKLGRDMSAGDNAQIAVAQGFQIHCP